MCSFSSSGVPKTQGCSFSKLKCSFFNKHQFRVNKSANQALRGSWSRKGSKRRRISGRAGVLHFWWNWLCRRLAVSIDSAADCGEYGHSLPHGETQERASSAEIKLKRVRLFRNVYITLLKLANGGGGLRKPLFKNIHINSGKNRTQILSSGIDRTREGLPWKNN